MSNSKIYIKLSNIGYQKPVDITITGINDIESAEIMVVKDTSIIVDNEKVFDEENTDYISNTEDNCVYEFIEDIEVLLEKDDKENVYRTDVTSIGHVIINKLKLEAEPTMYYKVVKYTKDASGKYAYNEYRKTYELYRKTNEASYKKEGGITIKFKKDTRGGTPYVTGENFSSNEGWVLERDENNQLIEYAYNITNNVYEVYDPAKRKDYFKSGGEKIGIPFILRLSYKNGDEIVKKSVYFAITIPYKTMGSNLELPLLYRPFYFNSVLLLTPQNLTESYYYDIRNLHTENLKEYPTSVIELDTIPFQIETDEQEKSRMTVNGNNNSTFPPENGNNIGEYENIHIRPVVPGSGGGGGGMGNDDDDDTNKNKEYYFIDLVNENQNVWGKNGKDFKTVFLVIKREYNDDKSIDRIYLIKNLTTYEGAKPPFSPVSHPTIIETIDGKYNWDNTNDRNSSDGAGFYIEEEEGYSYYIEKGKEGTCEFEINGSDYIEKIKFKFIYSGDGNFKINAIIRKEYKSESNSKCFGRLFYSIANGCSIREDLGDANLYKLNDVTLSYINGSKAGDMVIHKPFRCFNEIEETEMKYGTSIKGTKKLTKEMMYGITEPFLLTTYEKGLNIKEKRYLTQTKGESYKYKELYIGYTFGRSEERSVTWIHHYLTGENNGIDEEYKINWKSKYGCVYRNGEWIPKTRYKNTIEISKKIGGKWKKIAGGERDYRRTDTTWDFTDENGRKWIVDYVLYATATGESKITVSCQYERNYTINEQIKRCGLPCVEINDDEQKTLITYQSLEGNENEEITDRGIREVYCGLDSYSEKECTFSEDTGSIIPVYNEDKSLVSIIFDTSKWLDVSFSVTEGHPEDDSDADTAFIGLNDVKFYDDILWSIVEEPLYNEKGEPVMENDKQKTNKWEGVHVKGYSSSNVRYFAFGNFVDSDKNNNCGNEIGRFLENLYGMGVKMDKDGNSVRYNGVNTNDYIYIPSDYPERQHTKWGGWKGINTWFGDYGGGTVWISGKSSKGNWGCIDITDKLTDLRKNPYQKKDNKFGCSRERNFIIGICDNYTCLDASSYEQEKKQMYSVIKPHTSRFAVIRLYKIEKS